MKISKIYLAALILVAVPSIALNSTTPANKSEVELIQREFKSINDRAPKLKSREVIVLGQSAEGGSVNFYSEPTGDVVKITTDFLGETGKFKEEYYFKSGALFFAFQQNIRYSGHIMEVTRGKKIKETVTGEERFYFKDGALIQWLSGKKVNPSAELTAEGKKISGNASSYLALWKSVTAKKGDCEWECKERKDEFCVKFECSL